MPSLRLHRLSLWTATALLMLSCGGQTKGDAMMQARLDSNEIQLAKLTERLEILESKTGKLDGVGEGIQLLLQRLDEIGAGGGDPSERRHPSATATYSLPIDGDPFIGPKDAKVTMVKGYDFYCGYCDKVRPTLAELQKIYGKDLKIVFKNFVIHDEIARLPALAACAANLQGKFMPMFEQIWQQGIRSQQELNEGHLLAIAKALKLKEKQFVADMRGPCEEKVQTDFDQLSAVGATGTPAFYINGRFLSGALSIDKYQRVIDQELEKADRAIKEGVKLGEYYQTLVESGRKSI